MIRYFNSFIACSFFSWPIYATANDDRQLLQGFPSDIALQRLWDSVRFDEKESRTYRFNANQPLADVQKKLNAWLAHPSLSPQVVEKNGWRYLSHQKLGWWVTAQVRQMDIGTSSAAVEGLVTFWRTAKLPPDAARLLPFSKLTSLDSAKIIRRIESIDNGKLGVTATLVSQLPTAVIARQLGTDLNHLGMRPAPYAPPSLQSVFTKNESRTDQPISQAWLGANSQLIFTIFEHRGETAILIHWTTGKQDE
jgi:hypothetical protein